MNSNKYISILNLTIFIFPCNPQSCCQRIFKQLSCKSIPLNKSRIQFMFLIKMMAVCVYNRSVITVTKVYQ